MAFFDQLGKKASETTAKAVQKAQELSEISKLNGLISEEEKKLNAAYCQIGKLYVTVHGLDREEGFAEMVSSVVEGEQKINDYRNQIQNIKNAPQPKTGNTLPDDTVKCKNCGAVVKQGMRFCTSCGSPMNALFPAAPEVQRICSNCGAEMEEDVIFCTECGTRMNK